jgi:hypothetical protein
MWGRQWTVKLVSARLASVGLALSCLALGVVSSAAPAAAATSTATPACTFSGSSLPLVSGVSTGSKVVIACTGLPALRPYLLLQASLLIGIDPQAAALLSGGAPGPGTIESALAASPEIDPASFAFPISNVNGDLDYTYTVPSIQPLDPNATCPPSTPEFNAGLIGCALAMVDLTTQKPLGPGSAVLQYASSPFLPPGPTLALSTKKATPGTVVTVSDAPTATTFWWLATLAALEALLGGGSAPSGSVTVSLIGKHGVTVPAANSITITPATYNGTTLTPPAISGSFTVPSTGLVGKTQKVIVSETGDLGGFRLSIGAIQHLKV